MRFTMDKGASRLRALEDGRNSLLRFNTGAGLKLGLQASQALRRWKMRAFITIQRISGIAGEGTGRRMPVNAVAPAPSRALRHRRRAHRHHMPARAGTR